MLIATALVVRSARSDRLPGLQARGCEMWTTTWTRKWTFAVQVANRVLHALFRKHAQLFPRRREPIYAPDDESPARTGSPEEYSVSVKSNPYGRFRLDPACDLCNPVVRLQPSCMIPSVRHHNHFVGSCSGN